MNKRFQILGFALFGCIPLLLQQRNTSMAGELQPFWPGFRGVNSAGHASGNIAPPIEFALGKNEVWHIATPRGHSSPSVWGDRIFLTGLGANENQLDTFAISRTNGSLLWKQSVAVDKIERVNRVSNGATATCFTDGKHVVTYFGSFGLVCYGVDGKEFWRMSMPLFDSVNGSGTSPILFNGTIYLNREDITEQALIAVDVETGKERWHRQYPNASVNSLGVDSTPVLWKNQLILHRAGSITACDTSTGEVLWFLPVHSTGCSTPALENNKVVIGTWNNAGEADQAAPWPNFVDLIAKYDTNKDGKLSDMEIPLEMPITIRPELDPKLEGNVPFRFALFYFDDNKDGLLDAEEWKSGIKKAADYLKSQKHGIIAIDLSGGIHPNEKSVLWKVERNVPEVPSPLVYRDRVYAVRNGGILSCIDLNTGHVIYVERLGPLGPYYASPIEAGGNIYIAAGNGQIAVVKPGDEFQRIALNDLKEGLFATPAVVDGDLIVRTESQLHLFKR